MTMISHIAVEQAFWSHAASVFPFKTIRGPSPSTRGCASRPTASGRRRTFSTRSRSSRSRRTCGRPTCPTAGRWSWSCWRTTRCGAAAGGTWTSSRPPCWNENKSASLPLDSERSLKARCCSHNLLMLLPDWY